MAPSEHTEVQVERLPLTELFSAERRLQRRDQLARHLTTAQFRALMAFDEAEAVPAGQLARRAKLNPTTITTMLDNLEENGIVERGSDPRDRRVSLVWLTDKGRQIVEQRQARWDDAWKAHLGEFSEEEMSVLSRGLQAITGLLDSL